MAHSTSRRSLLAAMGYALLPMAHAADQGESAICLSVLYRNGPQARFDDSRYSGQYLPLLKSVCGDSVERVELRTPRPFTMPGMGEPGKPRPSGSHTPQPAAQSAGPQSPLLAAVSIWIRDAQAFSERTSAASRLAEELKQITEIEPLIQLDNVVGLLGDARDSVPAQGNVFSTYWPTTEGAQFDVKYYGEKVIPLMIKLYGAKSIRRVEFSMGVAQGGQAPTVAAASHFYVRDRAAWDAAGMQAYPQLMAEGPRYTTIRPLVADMQVAAAG
jgi:hypothetical protein